MEFRYVGRPVPRTDGVEKVTGQQRYAQDLAVAGMVHARVLRSPVPHARVVAIDIEAARAVPGVLAVVTGAQAMSYVKAPGFGPRINDQTPLAVDRVRYVGDPVVAVVAVSPEVADAALELVAVDYEELPAIYDPVEAMGPQAPRLHEGIEPEVGGLELAEVATYSNLCAAWRFGAGDVEAGFSQAARIFDDTFTMPMTQHVSMEPHATIAQVDPGQITLWTNTQAPSVIKQQMAHLFGLPQSHVRVIVPTLGSGWGAKLHPKLEPLAIILAMIVQRPVKMTADREEEFLIITKHPGTVRIRTGVDATGRIIARRVWVYLDAGAYADQGPRIARNCGLTGGGPYRIPNLRIESFCVYTNKPPGGAYRGFGVPHVNWAYESQADMIARELGLDPLAFRQMNMYRATDRYYSGQPMHGDVLYDSLNEAARRVNWAEGVGGGGVGAAGRGGAGSGGTGAGSDGTPGPTGPRRRGKGLASVIKVSTFPSLSSAILRMEDDGTVELLTSSVEMGQGLHTVLAQMVAERLGVPMEHIKVTFPDTDHTPYDWGSISSRSTFHNGQAALIAADQVRAELLHLAGDLFEVAAEDLDVADGRVFVKGTPGRSLTASEVIQRGHGGLRGGTLIGHGQFRPTGGDAAQGDAGMNSGQGRVTAFWCTGTGACEVEVDTETGHYRVLKYVTVMDAGKVINPVLAAGQIEGSVAMGLGLARTEEMRFEQGQPLNPNFLDYHIPALSDMPEQLETVFLEHPHPEGPYGAHGVGEAALCVVPAAIGNAIANAIGVRVRDLPITPEKILRLLRDRDALAPVR